MKNSEIVNYLVNRILVALMISPQFDSEDKSIVKRHLTNILQEADWPWRVYDSAIHACHGAESQIEVIEALTEVVGNDPYRIETVKRISWRAYGSRGGRRPSTSHPLRGPLRGPMNNTL